MVLSLRSHWLYLQYLLCHKWWVFWYCCLYGIPWRGIVHDLSKFRPDEWFPYVNAFYGPKPAKRTDGYYKPTDTGEPTASQCSASVEMTSNRAR